MYLKTRGMAQTTQNGGTFTLVILEEITEGNCGVWLYSTRAVKNNRPALSLYHFSMADQ